MSKSVVIIGAGFAGLSAACFMAKAGWKVRVIEQNATAGGRARQLKEEGFTFDMGPSWYWMPDVFERFFQQFDKKAGDYYNLKRLDPSYRIYWQEGYTDLPADYEELKDLFESVEKGSGVKLDRYLTEAAYKYKIGVQHLVYKPGQSIAEFFEWEVIKNMLRLDVFTSIKKHISRYFKNEKLRQIMEFPVLFLGALPEHTPALYSLMNYADIIGGTWYPEGGIYSVVHAMQHLAEELGVRFYFNEEVEEIIIEKSAVKRIRTTKNIYEADVIISGADYHFTESYLLPAAHRSYSEEYWNKRVLAPSCILYYVGLNKKLNNVLHHSLFFDVPFNRHAEEIYKNPQWPAEPLFYLSVASKTDRTVAPDNCENLVLLIPVASGLENDTDEVREFYFNKLVKRLEQHTGENILNSIVYKKKLFSK